MDDATSGEFSFFILECEQWTDLCRHMPTYGSSHLPPAVKLPKIPVTCSHRDGVEVFAGYKGHMATTRSAREAEMAEYFPERHHLTKIAAFVTATPRKHRALPMVCLELQRRIKLANGSCTHAFILLDRMSNAAMCSNTTCT